MGITADNISVVPYDDCGDEVLFKFNGASGNFEVSLEIDDENAEKVFGFAFDRDQQFYEICAYYNSDSRSAVSLIISVMTGHGVEDYRYNVSPEENNILADKIEQYVLDCSGKTCAEITAWERACADTSQTVIVTEGAEYRI